MGVVTVRALLSHAECEYCMVYPTPPNCEHCHNTRYEAQVISVIENPLPRVWGLSGVGKVIRKWGPGPNINKAIEVEQFIQELKVSLVADEKEWEALNVKMAETRKMYENAVGRYQRVNALRPTPSSPPASSPPSSPSPSPSSKVTTRRWRGRSVKR